MFNSPLPAAADLPSSAQLLRSTVIALLVATGLLVTVVMPSEYAIDPTGLGRVLGLQQMGEMKIALANEALAETQAAAPATSGAVPSQANAAPATALRATGNQSVPTTAVAPAPTAASSPAPVKSDTMTINLRPGEGREIKLEMVKGAKVRYEWKTSGGAVNFDTHGEPYNAKKGEFHSYSKGKQVTSDTGEFAALFDGTHGWFWRNRGEAPVTISLGFNGDYSNIKR
ncbi:hypothetical protein [Pseudomonas oryzihabitans]|uniref:Transmembrane anchor protein n=1 Tax=Pseudomonas oryzihabitans TaxID=47885 RepID=A0A178LDE2_9PSED|nr:hypothetical protein [Pseudomonas oryzihabitans]OAN28465.1 transmembrane anchor protein [Pseudomonas oryzihabitans]